ncbi:hypothetical protein OJ997_19920 [Solirubrobacter phytolaccae]|uniref:LppX_LprAFG lipoprotein n=1 Tax=Solirubrobacter phytolaccae TaxID=1404360 RepID=A0A9X3NA35_9ACTN|nr:hypothetical protein [Solirubrobacter phytolaccae]MDA0182588.1 hypothetical protein [Solirubrobacter phytolaccae]
MRFLGVLLATALLAAGCGADGSERASATSDARELLSATVNNLGSLQSATLDAKLDAAAGQQETQVAVRGPFEVGKKGETPRFAVSADVTAAGQKQTVGATSTGESAFVTLQGKTYEVPSMLAGQLTAGLEQALGQGGPLINIDLKRWVPNPVNAGTAEVGGVETIKLTGPADVRKVIADVNLLAGQLSALQLPGAGTNGKLPSKIPAEAADEVKDLTVTVYTGAEDQVLRRLVVEGTAATGNGRALLDLTLTKVGEDQDIAAPKGARPFAELLAQLQAGGSVFGG